MNGDAHPCRIYIGNLPEDITQKELADAYKKYGEIRDIDIKFGRTRNGTAYAFIEFDRPEEAEDAIYGSDGKTMYGVRLKVEYTGQKRLKRLGSFVGGGPPVRSDFRVVVLNLPRQVSWQDLKDHMRAAGPVGYAGIDEYGRGVVEYEDERGMLRALNDLHKTSFENPFGRTRIKVYLPEDVPDPRDRRRSPRRGSPSRSASPTRRGDTSYSPRRRDNSPSRRGDSPRDRDFSPYRDSSRGRSVSPRDRRRGRSLDNRSASPRRRSMSPEGDGKRASPRGRSPSPRGRSPSPRGRSPSPRGRSPSPRRHASDMSPRKRLASPAERSVSPKRRREDD